MNLKHVYISIIFIFYLFNGYSQEIDYSKLYGTKLPDLVDIKKNCELLNLSGCKAKGILPEYIDNSKLKYFPPIIFQVGASCAQASGIGYVYNYEVNCLLDTDAKSSNNRVSYMYAWNMLNNGTGDGGWAYKGWNLIKDNGGVTERDFRTQSWTEWPNGYKKYAKGTKFGVNGFKYIDANKDYKAAVNTIKQYLVDHGTGSKHGGLVIFTAFAHNLNNIPNYTGPSKTGYKKIVNAYSNDPNSAHSMTIVGYDDAVYYNGQYGAFICVNSWGSAWGDKGFFYMPYYLIQYGENGGGCSKYFYVVTVKERNPKLIFKVVMEHNSRNDLSFTTGFSDKKDANSPTRAHNCEIMRNMGGDHQMRGINGQGYKTFEFALNGCYFDSYFKEGTTGTFFLKIKDVANMGSNGYGKLVSFSVLDYSLDPDKPVEYKCTQSNVQLKQSSNTFKIVANKIIKTDYKSDKNISIFVDPEIEKEGKIKIDIKQNIRVNIALLDNNGLVKQLIMDETVQAGNMEMKWTPINVPKGEYTIRIIAHNQIFFKKVLIL